MRLLQIEMTTDTNCNGLAASLEGSGILTHPNTTKAVVALRSTRDDGFLRSLTGKADQE